MKISLQRALFGLVLVVLLVGLVPAAVLLDRRLVEALEQGVVEDLSTAPLVLRDRFANLASARMMHARDVAQAPGLVRAAARSDVAEAAAAVQSLALAPDEAPSVVGPDGAPWVGPAVPARLVEATRTGAMPVEVVEQPEALVTVALAPVMEEGRWLGAAGVWVPVGAEEAGQLSVLTRSDVLISRPGGGMGAYTGRQEPAMGLFSLLADRPATEEVREVDLSGVRYLVVGAVLPGGARVTFVRSLDEELAVVPALRAVGAGVLTLALAVAFAVGGAFASRLARPVRALGEAAERISEGHFDAAVEHSWVTEVDQVSTAFEVMRDALAVRIEELAAANRELEDRQERLSVLQAELVQRDRLSAASRLLAQLAHEIRNPVASVRNCLEVLRRRVHDDAEASELADLAIDELLRMHELAERMLDLHRPQPTDGRCDVAAVARDVVTVVRMGVGDRDVEIELRAPERLDARIPADSLKQVLLNLVQNAHESLGDSAGRIEIHMATRGPNVRVDVVDDGPGIDPDALPHVFDPFFTTKSDVRGVGLGLFTAAGIVRSNGGRIAASNRADGRGARLSLEIPLAEPMSSEASA
jgi:signal transduction histidine kinase